MTKETKTSAELQAIFRAELARLGLPESEKVTIQPAANNSRFTWSVFQADAGKDNSESVETARERIGKKLQDRYDLSDDP